MPRHKPFTMPRVKDRAIDWIDATDSSIREALTECGLTGRRALFLRNGRPVVALVSYDELVALEETIAIAGDPDLMARIRSADEAATANRLMLPEELDVE